MLKKRKTRAYFLWKPDDRLRRYLEKGLDRYDDVRLVYSGELPQKQEQQYIEEANIIIGWRPDSELIEKARNLFLFINPGAGVQHLLKLFREVTKNRTIRLINGHGNSYFTAQHALALLLALTNMVIHHHNWMKDGKWRMGDEQAASTPLRDITVGFLGYGAVNQKLHRIMAGFDVEFAACRNDWSKQVKPLPSPLEKYCIPELHDFLKKIDILCIAVPLNPDTTGLINSKELALMKTSGLLVNVARGPVVDEKALYAALSEKKIAGAALDVWYDYRPEPDVENKKYPSHKPFHLLDNVILSPHRSASPFSDLKRWDEVIENIKRFHLGATHFLNVVDLDAGY